MTKRLWEFQFEKLQSFKLMNGHCNVPTNFQHDSQLASWVKTQRKVSWSLSKDQIDRLNSIGFTWKIRETHIRVDWEVRFQELVDYKRVHGNCNVPLRLQRESTSREVGQITTKKEGDNE